MAGENRTQEPGIDWYAALSAQPYAFDFYQVLRRIDAIHRGLPRLGDALRPADEAVRLCQEPSLTFAPANVSAFEHRPHGPPRLASRFLGLFGPQGALPTHLTELARARLRSYGDPTLARFADLFHHRLLCAFYKAWRQAQPAACHDRPENDRFAAYIDALFGGELHDDALSHARRHFAGVLSRRTRNAAGLEAVLSGYFRVPVCLESFHARWMDLPRDQLSTLGGARNNCIGRSLVLGRRIRDAQHHFLLRIGPLTLAEYTALLPGSSAAARLRNWVRFYTDRQFGWRAQLTLRREEVPALQLGRQRRLGWDAWLGRPAPGAAVKGHLLNPEQRTAAQSAPGISAPAIHPEIRTIPEEEPCLK